MSIFNRFFSKTETKNNMAMDNKAAVNEDLFIDSNPPMINEKEASLATGIEDFLNQNFFHQGYTDGYDWHSKEMLENKIMLIKADFRHRLELKADVVRQEILHLENKKLEITGLLDLVVSKIENIAAEKRYILQKIKSEKELSAVDEGLVMTCIHHYKEGYLKGTNAYLEEELLASNKGLFN